MEKDTKSQKQKKENKPTRTIFITVRVIIVAIIVSIVLFVAAFASKTDELDGTSNTESTTVSSEFVTKPIETTAPSTKSLESSTENTTQQTTVKPTQPITVESTSSTEPTEIETEPIESTTEQEDEPTNFSWLIDIDNPDYDYTPQAISLSDGEREEIARIVMGEFGDSDFTGCALLAQSIRDGMATYGFSGYSVQSGMQYYGYNSNPNQTCYEAVDWIFSGNAAVQHRILIMNNASGGWHATQNFVAYYDGVWFYDLW